MTQATFLKRLRQTAPTWTLRVPPGPAWWTGRTALAPGAIRCAENRCPLEAVAVVETGQWYKAQVRLKLAHRQVRAIMNAADARAPYNARFRRQLLKATVDR